MSGRSYHRWTAADDAVVMTGFRRGDTADELARLVGTSGEAVRLRAGVIGVRHRRLQRSLEDRFHEYAIPEPNSGCWLWAGACDRHGYGQLRVKGATKYASHIALRLAGTEVPAGMYVCHHCDNPFCVNPDHLFLGTQKDNIADCIRKRRASKPPVSQPGQGAQDFCHKGHPLSGDNAYLVAGTTWKRCRECTRQLKAERRARFIAMGLRSDGLPRVAQ